VSDVPADPNRRLVRLAGLLLLALTVPPALPSWHDFVPASPHERYRERLRASGFAATAFGRDWNAAADAALRVPAEAASPMRVEGVLAATPAAAASYAWTLRRGRRLSLAFRFDGEAGAEVFADVFAIEGDGQPPRRVASLEPGRSTLVVDVPRDARYVLRLQPELLRGARFAVAQRTLASLPFPIAGNTPPGPRSDFGAVRDAGRRSHEGVDLFAPRGTPVVAVAAGLARASTNRLGGNVVWLHAPAASRTFYYAHLDRWAIDGWRYVRPGDVLGYVGTTGNARTTPPHLHFGIYSGGAIDPWPFVRPDDAVPGYGARAAISGR
jgi:murein DD-endopeptidase MepM/ murein hydrolase activator NlpD